MVMTNEEICRDYRQAKQKQKQIGILAELNQCDKITIVSILKAGGEQLPGNYYNKPQPKKTKSPAPDMACPVDTNCPQEEDAVKPIDAATLMAIIQDAASRGIVPEILVENNGDGASLFGAMLCGYYDNGIMRWKLVLIPNGSSVIEG